MCDNVAYAATYVNYRLPKSRHCSLSSRRLLPLMAAERPRFMLPQTSMTKLSLALSDFMRCCEDMKNITVSLDEETYGRARIKAAERDTSVSALVRGFLVAVASESLAPEGSNARSVSCARVFAPSQPAIVCPVMTRTGATDDKPAVSRHQYPTLLHQPRSD